MPSEPLHRRRVLRGLAGVGFATSVAGCSGGGTDDVTGTTEPETSTPPATATTAAPQGPSSVGVAAHPTYGEVLVDGDGNTLYAFEPDDAGASTCYGECAGAWPPLTVGGGGDLSAGTGIGAELSTAERDGGGLQVTAAGWPLYYFAGDREPGDVNGQGLGNAWWVLRPDGSLARSTVSAGAHDALGSVLTDADGRVLYMFTPDEQGPSTCYGGCAETWPPLTAEAASTVLPAATIDADLGTVERDDGSLQVTAGGWPLYYFAGDEVAGQARGQEVQNVWFALRTDGSPLKPTVSARSVGDHGEVLTDRDGMTLYAFDDDGTGPSTCYGGCAEAWPPLTVEAEGAIVESVRTEVALATAERDDGSLQVTAGGRPLYYYAGDDARGDANGQGVNDAWWLVDPGGAVLQTQTPTRDDDDDDDGGSGY